MMGFAGCVLGLMVAAAGAAMAEEAMNGDEFATYVTGKTVTYAREGQVYGIEQYLPGRRVLWRQLDGECQEGVWFETNDMICFEYGAGIPLQCWQFFRDDARLGARADGDPQGLWLYEVRQTSEPLMCPAPFLGA